MDICMINWLADKGEIMWISQTMKSWTFQKEGNWLFIIFQTSTFSFRPALSRWCLTVLLSQLFRWPYLLAYRMGCQPRTLHIWACSHLQIPSNLTSRNSKHQRPSNGEKKSIQPWRIRKAPFWGTKDEKSEALHLSRWGSTIHHKYEDCLTRQLEKRMGHKVWDERGC